MSGELEEIRDFQRKIVIMKLNIELFFTGFLQVFLVAINTWQISKQQYVGAFLVGTMLSFVWTFNVKKMAFGMLTQRIYYSLGAGTGTLIGLLIASKFL